VPRNGALRRQGGAGLSHGQAVIELIGAIAARVNADPAARELLRVAFIPNYNVSLAEAIMPARTCRSRSPRGDGGVGHGQHEVRAQRRPDHRHLDGANVEILEAVGRDGLFLFGLDEPGVTALRQRGYVPRRIYDEHPVLRDVLDLIASGELSPRRPGPLPAVVDSLLATTTSCCSPISPTTSAARPRSTRRGTTRKAGPAARIRTTARMGGFSSDLTIARYASRSGASPSRMDRRLTGHLRRPD